jgi:hypothetical protein
MLLKVVVLHHPSYSVSVVVWCGVVCSIQDMGFFKKFKFWRRRGVGADSQKRTEEYKKKVEEGGAKNEQLEVMLHSRIKELEKELERRDEEFERREHMWKELEAIHRSRIIAQQDAMDESAYEWQRVKVIHNRHVIELEKEIDNKDAKLCGLQMKLKKKKKKKSEMHQMEGRIHGWIQSFPDWCRHLHSICVSAKHQ